MADLREQLLSKERELAALKKIAALTDTMKLQLNELSDEVKQIEGNAQRVNDVMSIWNSVTRSISEASLGLLRYVEKDYEVGIWDDDNVDGDISKTNSSNDEAMDKSSEEIRQQKEIPLPETLVRVPINEEKHDI
ncbi:hypothetical protein KAFR_0D02090 [Kazachstania africana CBS 2517]|uniref:DASH complex subunit DAD2 n=1 Tax=Kazachstania africana (strain ATCC 22294 / BCRC 22015 / CBS 2517 / CECT 1963 / NBRC 1671 / NRRL Y-8276) TaxID=1071382 RepID=H2AU06_KAZAF|nr:hypothetical protein KAFR_0D02090 [Kazachstania africana CBS 2517]CCF57856.1 hypothetical protein KAFR_0D02090 [Kazachstania africana CBS 2517]